MTSCIEWSGTVNQHGYGVHPDRRYAHRVAWEQANGPIPPGACVLHECDNRRCINPDHLHLGSRRQNSAEMVERGRSGRGEAHSQAKLTADQVVMIRELAAEGWTHERIGRRYGVSRSAVGAIVTRRRWAHLWGGLR